MVQFHVLQRSCFYWTHFLFEGSPSKSANLKKVVELKFMPAAIDQSTPAINYSPLVLRIVLLHLTSLWHLLQTLLSEGSISSGPVCRHTGEKV